jgi:DNA processing protein
MDYNDLKYWLALHSVDGIGAATFLKLLDRFGSPQEVFRASVEDIANLPRLSKAKAEEILQAHARIEEMGEIMTRLDDAGVSIVTFQDDNYPQKLLELKNPPVILFIYGQIKPEDENAIAIVGSREASDKGVEIARGFGHRLAERGFSVISGYAKGIDTAGHLGALEGGGRTIMVLSNGVFHFKLRDAGFESFDFLKQRGAVVSEFFPTMSWTVGAAMARNRIVVALSKAVLVVECRPQSGTMNTVQVAREMKRKLFVLNYQSPDEFVGGNKLLIESGAIPIQKYSEIAMIEKEIE